MAWSVDGHEEEGDQPHFAGCWMEATFENRRDLKIIVRAGNEVCGPGTHWIEVREEDLGADV